MSLYYSIDNSLGLKGTSRDIYAKDLSGVCTSFHSPLNNTLDAIIIKNRWSLIASFIVHLCSMEPVSFFDLFAVSFPS